MADSSDQPTIFQKFLKIATRQVPPDHYTLLGIQPLESDPGTINAAVKRRLDLLESRKDEGTEEEFQEVKAAIQNACECLISEDARANYEENVSQRPSRSRLTSPPAKAKAEIELELDLNDDEEETPSTISISNPAQNSFAQMGGAGASGIAASASGLGQNPFAQMGNPGASGIAASASGVGQNPFAQMGNPGASGIAASASGVGQNPFAQMGDPGASGIAASASGVGQNSFGQMGGMGGTGGMPGMNGAGGMPGMGGMPMQNPYAQHGMPQQGMYSQGMAGNGNPFASQPAHGGINYQRPNQQRVRLAPSKKAQKSAQAAQKEVLVFGAVGFVLVFLLLVGVYSWNTPASQANRLYIDAQSAVNAGNFDRGRVLIERAIELDKKDEYVRYQKSIDIKQKKHEKRQRHEAARKGEFSFDEDF